MAPIRWAALAVILAGCVGGDRGEQITARQAENIPGRFEETTGLFDILANQRDPQTNINVNRFIWNAALDTLSFLPLEAADPFSGVFVTGYGVPPGGSQAFRATVYVQGAALDAGSLRVALFRRAGGRDAPASDQAIRDVEDAILTRARQLRIAFRNAN